MTWIKDFGCASHNGLQELWPVYDAFILAFSNIFKEMLIFVHGNFIVKKAITCLNLFPSLEIMFAI